MLHAVIMAGGAGTRFWPASRAAKPKQLLDLAGGQTMIQATVARLGELVPPDRVLVVTNERLVDAIAEQIPQLPRRAMIGEPAKRDTAPCIGLAAFELVRTDPDATMAVMPADHVIHPATAFQRALVCAADLVRARPSRLVTFGIRPTYPAETFGYIERDRPLDRSDCPGRTDDPPAFRVARFHEKPKADAAREYCNAGDFYWNSGIFVWKARAILDALARFEPEMYGRLERIAAAAGGAAYQEVLRSEFTAIRGKSIDYAVMERADDVVVIEAPFQWDDVGSWPSLARLRGADAEGNTIVARHLGLDTTGCIVGGDDDHLIVTVGMSDCIIIHTPDATLVADKHREESIRRIAEMIREKGWTEFL